MISGVGPASFVILAVNIGLGLLSLLGVPKLIELCLFRPYEFARGQRRATVITSAFVHADLPHLVFNMITFWYFGVLLERRIGTAQFVLLYAVGLLLSQLGSYIKHRNNPQYATLGASGAISAVLFAAILYFPTMKLYLFFIPVGIPAPLFAVGYLAYSFWSARQSRDRINHDAHLGGALAGLAFVAVFDLQTWARAVRLIAG